MQFLPEAINLRITALPNVNNCELGFHPLQGHYPSLDTLQGNNIVGNYGANNPYYNVYLLSPSATQGFSMSQNYWGTTDTSQIDTLIYDFLDDFSLGQVIYQPIQASPVTTAPAFLSNLNIGPGSPIGIQQATFTLTFSRPVDQSANPVVTFGATSPYTSYAVLDNAQWLSNTQWRATYDITSLVPRGTYTISVSSAKGTDGMEIPTDTRFAFTVDYAGQITDQTPPPPPTAFATGKPSDVSAVEATWSASDPESAIIGYRYAIGTAAGTADIVNWTTTTATSMSRSGLGLVAGRQYWFAVQAKNAGGLWSASANRSFVAGQQSQSGVFLPFITR
jgi:hypothetical protein